MSLKCCNPNGIPTIVIQKNKPNRRWVSTIQIPPNTSQIIFITVDKQPTLDEVSVILTPNGAKPTIANLKHWIPNGIPTMVRHKINPPKIYWKKIKIPPKTTQIILPIKLIVIFNLRVKLRRIVT